MIIKFQIEESLEKIMLHANTDVNHPIIWDENTPKFVLNESVSGQIYDIDFGVGAEFNAIIFTNGDGCISLTTQWSGFSYYFESRNGTTCCTYEGAFQGFNAQNLNFRFTPILNGTEKITSSIMPGKELKYNEYLEIHSDFVKFKETVYKKHDYNPY